MTKASVTRAARKAAARDVASRTDAKRAAAADSFQNFAMNLGIGTDNPLSGSTYGFNPITRNRTLLEWIHRGSWIGGLAVDVVADDMTRAGVEILGSIPPEELAALEERLVSLAAWSRINETIKWSRLYGGAMAVFLIDGQDMSTPLRVKTVRKDQFRGLLVLDRWMVDPQLSDLVKDFGPDLGLPRTYRVTGNAPALQGELIHHTRCIRLSGVKLPHQQALVENLWGLSELERLYDRMVSFDSATTGAAQLVYKAYMRTMKIDGLREVVAAGGPALKGLTEYLNATRRYAGIEGVTIIDSQDDLTADSHSAFGGLSDALAQFGQQLSGALQIPLVRLFGQSPAGFNTGEADLRSYYDGIHQRQERDLRVGVTRLYRIAAASEGITLPEGTRIEFRSLWDLSSAEKATVAQTTADTIKGAEEAGLISRATALKELRQSSTITGIFTNITDEQIEEADAEGPPIPEDVEVAQIQAGARPPEGDGQPTAPAGLLERATDAGRRLLSRLRGRDAASRAAGVLFTSPEGVLLLRRSTNSDHPGEWGLPGGRIEAGETEAEAACREVREETGYRVEPSQLRIVESGGGYTTFKHDTAGFVPRLNPEHIEYAWHPDPLTLPDLHPNLRATLKALETAK